MIRVLTCLEHQAWQLEQDAWSNKLLSILNGMSCNTSSIWSAERLCQVFHLELKIVQSMGYRATQAVPVKFHPFQPFASVISGGHPCLPLDTQGLFGENSPKKQSLGLIHTGRATPRAHKLECFSFDDACVQCGHSQSHQ